MKKVIALMKNLRQRKSTLVGAAAAVGTLFVGAEVATALGAGGSADTTFDDATNMLTDWSTGSFGKMASIAALVVGIAMGIIRGTVVAVVGAVAIALALYIGPGVLQSVFTAGIPTSVPGLN